MNNLERVAHHIHGLEMAGQMQIFIEEKRFENWAKEIYNEAHAKASGKPYEERDKIFTDAQQIVINRRHQIAKSNNEYLYKVMIKVDGADSDALKWLLEKNPKADIAAFWVRRLSKPKKKK